MSEMNVEQWERMTKVLTEVFDERERQHRRWGEQNFPDGTSFDSWAFQADAARVEFQDAASDGRLTYLEILREEVLEAFSEEDPAKLRAELVQVAAVAVQWIESIDRRARQSLVEEAKQKGYQPPMPSAESVSFALVPEVHRRRMRSDLPSIVEDAKKKVGENADALDIIDEALRLARERLP